MLIADKETMLISFINTLLSDKNNDYYLLQPELNGSVKVDTGDNKRKKYQFVNGDICIPHSCLKEEYKTDFKVISKMKMPMYCYIKKEYVSDDVNNKVKESEEDLHKFLENNPEVEKSLNSLYEALRNAKY